MHKVNDLQRVAFDIRDLLGYRISRLSAAIGQEADRDAERIAGLGLPEYRVLVVLASTGPQGVAGLQEAMLIDKAWISRTLNKLVKKKLAVSTFDDNDARRSLFKLTPKGCLAAKRLTQRAKERQEQILRNINQHDRKRLFELLSQVQDNVDFIKQGR